MKIHTKVETFTIFVCKETRADEARVSLIPDDVKTLVKAGHTVFVESQAGIGAGFTDEDYRNAGANIRELSDSTLPAYQALFKGINFIVRAKRPDEKREALESAAIASGTIMIGALDPFEKASQRIADYHKAGIQAYSIDQAILPTDDPKNILSSMSKITGKLALEDAIQAHPEKPKSLLIIGFGTVGQAALEEAKVHSLNRTVALTNTSLSEKLNAEGIQTILLNKADSLEKQQQALLNAATQADIILCSARQSGKQAPLLIPQSTLDQLKPGTVVIDLALSEGGNVEGSEHDAIKQLENKVIIKNVSGYPKAIPKEASKLWSRASLAFIQLFSEEKKLPLTQL